MPLDLALSTDPANARTADLRWAGRDLALDATPLTPAVVALLCDRRARPDDALPVPAGDPLAPAPLSPRRGWCGDALDTLGRRIGSRLWLLERAMETEATRRRAELYAREALAPVAAAAGVGLEVTATWVRRGVLRLVARLGPAELAVERRVAE